MSRLAKSSTNRSEWIVRIILVAVGIITLIPAVVVLRPDLVSTLYGTELNDPAVLSLLQHRGMYFATIAGLLSVSIYKHSLRRLAIILTLILTVIYIIIASIGEPSSEMINIANIDILLSIGLIVALYIEYKNKN